MNVSVQLTTTPKQKPKDESTLRFGTVFTDHMLIIDYDEANGWHDARIVPHGPLETDPSMMIFHYGQAIFEGFKAYRCDDGKIRVFRPDMNMKRINNSNARLCIPEIDEDEFEKATLKLIEVDKDWVPSYPGTSLYVRPFIIATDACLGVHAAKTYKYIVILSPVGPYYATGLAPVRIYVEDKYVRAVRGGMGYAKTPGNYAASIKAGEEAAKKGYAQVLWLDGVEHKYVDEVGAMNVFFKIDGKVITPELSGSILPGITRNSVINILRDKGIEVEERPISMKEVFDASQNGTLEEMFGTGTAAVISPVGELFWDGETIIINNMETGPLSQMLYDTVTGIQSAKLPDPHGWTKIIG
ncbi:MAG: branched-chain amino acid aminotransferase [Clostridia bacterium]|nr:branched-chain amino acid aminotransferase [Clostridia bacterium]